MTVYVIGNPLIPEDSRPLVMLPELRKHFPSVTFLEADPNENFIPENGSVILDTVKGIIKPTLYTDMEQFEKTARVSPHDYDLGFHLRLLLKLGKISQVLILGIPEHTAFTDVAHLLETCVSSAQ